MVNDDNDYKLDVYKIDTRTKLDKKRIFIMVILILLLFCILLTINHIKNLMEEKRASILSKLSDDEKDFISFQSFNEVFKMIKANEKEAKTQYYKNLKKNKP